MGLIAGTLLVLISIAHNVYGEKKQIPELRQFTNDPVILGSLRIMIYQGGILLFAVGLIQILVSLEVLTLTGWARYIPVGIVLINFFTTLLLALSLHREILKVTIPQFIVFTIIIALQLLSL